MSGFTESIVEDATLAWLESLGFTVLHGPDIARDELREMSTYRQAASCGDTT